MDEGALNILLSVLRVGAKKGVGVKLNSNLALFHSHFEFKRSVLPKIKWSVGIFRHNFGFLDFLSFWEI